MPRIAASLAIALRGSISTRPRLPMTTTRAPMRQHVEVVVQVHVRQHLEHDVHAASVRQRRHLLQVAGVAVVQRMVRALRAYQREALLGARRRDHRQAMRARHLDGGRAHAAAAAVHQHAVARLRMRTDEQRAPRGGVRHTQRRALRERDACGQRVGLPVLAQRDLRAAADGRVRVDAVAGLDVRVRRRPPARWCRPHPCRACRAGRACARSCPNGCRRPRD